MESQRQPETVAEHGHTVTCRLIVPAMRTVLGVRGMASMVHRRMIDIVGRDDNAMMGQCFICGGIVSIVGVSERRWCCRVLMR